MLPPPYVRKWVRLAITFKGITVYTDVYSQQLSMLTYFIPWTSGINQRKSEKHWLK